MPGLTEKQLSLLSDTGFSAHSLKFYNGTYTCDTDGFTDEHGIYRTYDCYDEAARAPTPLPSLFTAHHADSHSPIELSYLARRDSLDAAVDEKEKHEATPHTPPACKAKSMETDASHGSNASSMSSLSSCPSSLSNWIAEDGERVQTNNTTPMPLPNSTPARSKKASEVNAKATEQARIRGVAQKNVRKAAPRKMHQKKDSTQHEHATPATLSVQSSTLTDDGTDALGRRRSVRQARLKGSV